MRKITNKNKSISRVVTAIALAISLSACEVSSVRRGAAYDITAPAVESSSFYIQKATQEPTAQADWYLLAAKALIRENRLSEASEIVLRLAKMPLIEIQIAEWQLIRAEILLLRGEAKSATQSLTFNSSWKLPKIQWRRYFALQYNIFIKLGDLKNAFIASVNQERYMLHGEEQQLSDQTWNVVSKIPVAELEKLSVNIPQAAFTTWITLVTDFHQAPTIAEKQQAIEQWVKANSDRLAARFLPTKLTDLNNLSLSKPSNVGVILPLSQKFARQGETIRNGLMHALINDKSTDSKPEFNFYDANVMSMESIIADMKSKSVDFVIGPLQKNKVQEFITQSKGEFRHLALNIPSSDFLNSGSCFFTLSPEQEAEQAALRIAKKHKYPAVIAPSNELGKRVSSAFTKQWQEATGRGATVEFFTNSAGMQKAVARSMGLAQSQSRIYQLNQLLGLDLVAEPRSRRDIDAIYLIAGPGELTLLKPFIEISVNPGVKLPKLYASSRSNNQPKNLTNVSELNGIEFSDVPLLIKPTSAQAKNFHQLWPDMSNNMIRLYALGMDSYALLDATAEMQVNPKYQYKGESGTLFIEAPCTINRTMPWAVYSNSGAKWIE